VVSAAGLGERRNIDFLAEVTQAAERNPELGICHTDQDRRWDVLWIEDLPADAEKLTPGSEDTVFSMRPPVREQAPRPPTAPWPGPVETTRSGHWPGRRTEITSESS